MVVSVEASYREFVDALDVEKSEAAAWPPFLGAIAGEAGSRGNEVSAGPIALLWALSDAASSVEAPDDLGLRRLEADWMNGEQASLRFTNALGTPGQSARTERNQFTIALFDSTEEPVAVAGVFQTLGLWEIGVDVVPAAQGRGLAPIVVQAAALAVIEAGEVPLYACAATNTRSQRRALASGFFPVGSDAAVY